MGLVGDGQSDFAHLSLLCYPARPTASSQTHNPLKPETLLPSPSDPPARSAPPLYIERASHRSRTTVRPRPLLTRSNSPPRPKHAPGGTPGSAPTNPCPVPREPADGPAHGRGHRAHGETAQGERVNRSGPAPDTQSTKRAHPHTGAPSHTEGEGTSRGKGEGAGKEAGMREGGNLEVDQSTPAAQTGVHPGKARSSTPAPTSEDPACPHDQARSPSTRCDLDGSLHPSCMSAPAGDDPQWGESTRDGAARCGDTRPTASSPASQGRAHTDRSHTSSPASACRR